MEAVVVRRAEVADLARVAAIFAHHVTDSVATFEEEPPAYRHTVEDSVYLAPGHTGRGIGSAREPAERVRRGASPWPAG